MPFPRCRGCLSSPRNSTFTYKGKVVKAKQVSEELGVRYVLEGSIQRSGTVSELQCNWSMLSRESALIERYDGETKDLFTLQDDITMKVLGVIRVKLESLGGSGWISKYKGTHGLDCFLNFRRRLVPCNVTQWPIPARLSRLRKRALRCAQRCRRFYRLLAIVNINYYWFDSSKSPQGYIEKAEEFLQKTLAMDENNSEAYGNLSQLSMIKRDYDKALAEAEKSLTLDPGSSWCLWRYCQGSNHHR